LRLGGEQSNCELMATIKQTKDQAFKRVIRFPSLAPGLPGWMAKKSLFFSLQ
jgi:hypothetical protein